MIEELIDFIDIKIVDTDFEVNTDFEGEDIHYQVNFQPAFYINKENKTDGIVRVVTTVFDEDFKEKNQPFYLEMTVQGHFNSEKTGKELSEFYMNCLNITIPYIRSYVTTFTSLAGINPVTFPPINIYDLIEKISSEEDEE
ncbi:protein-export chaperone SecB [Planococcus soli]|uniref:protein-export chaperone SecB n=1 Tax=Planococcus soli TaxID=2666072 RepID=UPI00115D1E56|nr:protein-export chaperone SecB [Planococcus soli]